jgi:hypothetical protein
MAKGSRTPHGEDPADSEAAVRSALGSEHSAAPRTPLASWERFAREAPKIAAAGERLLVGSDGVAIGFLASGGASAPHLSPVCPVFCDGDVFVIAPAHTPKARDLREHGGYVLHAFLGASDEEFQIAGRAAEVSGEAERARVHSAVRFASFGRADPIFRLGVARALWVFWERAGRPDTRAVRKRWRAS